MKHWMVFLLCCGLLAACTPADVQYCRDYGVEGTSEYGKCLDHFHAQQAAFEADREGCDLEADMTYPPSLYDYGGYARTHGGIGYDGHWYGGQTIHIDPDWRKNREIDRLRMRIIEPCMQAKGWVSGRSWQAGRQVVRPQKRPRKRSVPPAEKLPWLK